jgi:hypothetical protein
MTEYEGPFENGRTYYLKVKLHATPDDYLFEYNANIDWLRYKEITLNGRDISYSTVRRYDSDKHFLYLYLPYTASNSPDLILKRMSTDGIELAWSTVYGFSSYDLYRDGVKIATVNGNSYLDNVGRTMGTWYGYKVIGVNGDDYSGFSELEEVLYNPFVDVSPVSEYFTYVSWAYNNEIVNGLSSDHTRFDLLGKCTRTQFCIMLWRMAGKPSTAGMSCPFVDISSVSANNRKGIIWCYNKKIVNGVDSTHFNPSGDITRAQLAIMVWKYAGQPKIGSMTCPFTDIASLSSNNKKAIIWCYNKGLIPSITGTLFEPSAKGTRALLTEMLYGLNLTLH